MSKINWYWKSVVNRRRQSKLTKRIRIKLKESNLCRSCRKPKEQANKIRCNACLEVARIKARQLRQDKRELNECLRCAKTAKVGFLHCEDHLEKLKCQKKKISTN